MTASREWKFLRREWQFLDSVGRHFWLNWYNNTIAVMPEGPDKEAYFQWFVELWNWHMNRKHRNPGGGRKPSFQLDRITQLQNACRTILRREPTLRKHNDTLVERLRSYLNNNERSVSSDNLLRKIIRPVLRSLDLPSPQAK